MRNDMRYSRLGGDRGQCPVTDRLLLTRQHSSSLLVSHQISGAGRYVKQRADSKGNLTVNICFLHLQIFHEILNFECWEKKSRLNFWGSSQSMMSWYSQYESRRTTSCSARRPLRSSILTTRKGFKEGFYGMKFDQNQSYISSCESKSRTFWP